MQNKMYLSDLPGSLPVSCINIAGSHDSGTAYPSFSKWSQCQNLTIRQQLDAGVRFFDIRLFEHRGVIRLVHSTADCFEDESKKEFLTFKTVLDWCTEFLKQNPRETIIMSVKKDRGLMGPFSKMFFNSFYNKYVAKNDIWFTENRIPLLDEVRGKIVLFRRCKCKRNLEASGGLNFSVWKNQSSSNDTEPFKVKLNDSFCAVVQDSYSVEPHKKWRIAESFMQNHMPNANCAAVNFLSTSGSGGPAKTAELINASFENYIFKKNGPTGWVLLDFVSKDFCNKIMQTNEALYNEK